MDAAVGSTWDVFMNGAKVCALSDAEYRAIRKYVLTDWRNLTAQLFNIFYATVAAFSRFIMLVPIVAFWLITAFVFFRLESFEIAHETDLSHIILVVKSVLYFSTTVSMIAIAFLCVTGCKFEFKNV
jgi:hypothetical protein